MSDDVSTVLAAEDRRYQAMIDTDLATLDEMLDHRLSYCLLYTSPSPRDISGSRMPSSA